MAESHIYAMIPTSFLFLSLPETVFLRNDEMLSDLRWQISEKCAISPIRKSRHNDWTVSWVDGQREYSQFSPVVMVMSAVRICLSHGDRELPHSVASLACHIVVPSWARIDECRARVGAQCPGHAQVTPRLILFLTLMASDDGFFVIVAWPLPYSSSYTTLKT